MKHPDPVMSTFIGIVSALILCVIFGALGIDCDSKPVRTKPPIKLPKLPEEVKFRVEFGKFGQDVTIKKAKGEDDDRRRKEE